MLCFHSLVKKTMDLHQIFSEFRTEQDFQNYLIKRRWPNGAKCPNSSEHRTYKRRNSKRFTCNNCNRSFSVTSGTIFHSSRLPLSKWFLAISVILSAKKGISSLQLARTIGVNKNTAWYMQKRLRTAMQEDLTLSGIVEIDETYIGGNLGNMKKDKKQKRNPFKSGMIHKVPVLGMIERGGKVVLKVIPHANKAIIRPILRQRISLDSTIVTDGFGPYRTLKKEFNEHISINHDKKEKAKGIYNLSSIEGFFSTIKRAIIGQYHQISPDNLSSYMDEINFKFNHSSGDSFDYLIRKCVE